MLVQIACAPKMVPVPVVTVPKYPEFIAPRIPAAFADSPAAQRLDRGWRFLQAGDLKGAEREFFAALTVAPVFYPAEVSLGYVEIARKDPKAGLPHFDRVLLRHPNDVDAQVGRGQAFLALGHNTEARAAFEAAVALDPSLTDIARRVDVLKFLSQQEDLRRAREAARAGRSDKAIREYTRAIASSPDTPFLYRELADVEWQKGDADAALEHFRKAAALDPFDARALSRIGEILESRADFDGAIKAYSDALAIDPNATMEARIEAVRARVHLARLPDEYRTIATLPKITRGDLAALIGVRLSPLLQGSGRDAVVVTDAHNHWAARWIIEVTRAGMVEAFANHTFQPGAVVRRIDLAQAVSRLLARIPRVPNQPRSWQSARLKFPDLSPRHLVYLAASQAVASGVMAAVDGTFQPSRPVSGGEATEAIARLEALAGVKAPQ